MARYVLILKEAEDESFVSYKFGPNEAQMGLLQLNKETGEVKEIIPAPIQTENPHLHQ
jgi:hypothetical protein